MQDRSEWKAYHLYLGEYADRTDSLLGSSLPSVMNTLGGDWFFIRYTDQFGPHIRVRTKNASGGDSAVENCLSQLISDLPFMPRNISCPLVTFPAALTKHEGLPTVRTQPYEPELDKYYGVDGVAIAERQFVANSKFATETLCAEDAIQFSRKTILPRLLMEGMDVALEVGKRTAFCEEYAGYWLRTAGAASLEAGFRDKAVGIARAGHPIVVSDCDLPVEIQKILAAWRAGMMEAFAEYEALSVEVEGVNREHLLLCFLHLLYNQLGMNMIEEAYIATLGASCLAEQSEKA